MSEIVTKHQDEGQTSVVFSIEADEVMAIGEKMEAIDEQAYMNGYNWEAFLNYYLKINYPDLLQGLDTDSEAGAYVALYQAENKADQLVDVIKKLIAQPNNIYIFLEENGEDVEWD